MKKYLLFAADSSHITHSIRLVVLEKKVEWKGLQYQIIWNYLVNTCVVLYCLLDHTYTYNLLDTEWRYQNFDRNRYRDFFSDTKFSETAEQIKLKFLVNFPLETYLCLCS